MDPRRPDRALLAVALALLAAAAAYLIAYGAALLRPRPSPVPVRAFRWRQTVPLTGAVIREETPLLPARGFYRVTADEGQRLAVGEAAAVTYDGAEDFMRSWLLLRLRRELAALETAPSVTEEDALLRRRCDRLSAALVRGDFDGASAAACSLSLGLFPGRSRDAEPLRREIRALESAGAGEGLVTAARGGFFSPTADGWESLSPDGFRELTCGGLEAVLRSLALPTEAAGRLVTGGTWLLAVLTDGLSETPFAPGDTVPLVFDGLTVDGEVILLRREADGRAAVVFRCREGLASVLSLRVLTVQAVTDRAEGLLIPAEALHRENGACFVWRRAGAFLRREEVELLRLLPEGALVSSAGLREGDTVVPGDPEEAEGRTF